MASPFHPVQITLGLIIWSIYFVALYAGLSIACQHVVPAQETGAMTWLNLTLLAGTFIVFIGLLLQAWRSWKIFIQIDPPVPASKINKNQTDETQRLGRFMAFLGAAVYSVAALATLMVGTPTLVLMPCI